MKFNKLYLLYEEWVDTIKASMRSSNTDIFVNPSQKEFIECGDWCRGLILPNGNFYIIDYYGIHLDIIEVLYNKKLLDETITEFDFYNGPEHGVLVQQFENSNVFKLGESVDYGEGEAKEAAFKIVQKYYNKAKQFNPTLEFSLDFIN